MTKSLALEAPDTMDLENEGNAIVEHAQAFIVNDAGTYATAGKMMLAFKSVITRLKETLDPAIKSAHETHRKLTTLRNDRTGPYARAEAKLKNKMIEWRHTEESRVRREQEAAERERQRLAEEQARKAEELRQADMPEAAEKMVAAEPPPPAPVIRSEVPKIEGVSARKTWGYKIVDETQIKRAYLAVNMIAIRAAVKSMGKLAEEQVGGIQVYEDMTIAGRTG